MTIKKSLILAAFTLAFFVFNQASAEEIKFISQQTDSLGQTHVRYNQYFNGVPVFGGQLIKHFNADRTERLTTGQTLPRLAINTEPAITAEQAIDTAKKYWQEEYKIDNFDQSEATLYIFNPLLFTGKKSDDNTSLVFEVELTKDRPAYHKFYYINAQTNEITFQIDGHQDAVHRHVWDCSYGLNDGNCYMGAYDYWYGYYVGRHEGSAAIGSNPYWWITQKTETDNLYDLFGQMHSYYETKFARNGGNNSGGIGDGTSTYPTESTTGLTYIDFYYLSPDQEYNMCPNAFFNGTNSIHFCQGEISADLIGHEYGHAVNYFSVLNDSGAPAGLTYSGDSGALNEANSDIFGEALETYNSGTCDWQHGTGTPGGISRSMSDPSSLTYDVGEGATPYPESYNDTNFYCGTQDGGGVHLNSSVGNYAAYLMAVGGTVKGCTITGIGQDKIEKIFYRAENVYYTPATTFNQAYTAILQSCYDLYGTDSTDCNNVKLALIVTEFDSIGKCNGGIAATDLSSVCTQSTAPPTIASITSDTADGYYTTGAVIDIDVNFSEAVTSAGDVTLTLETGDIDQTCAFTVSNATTGICSYTVQAGDNIADLTVLSITGALTDSDGTAMADFTTATNLADSKAITIDTKKPGYPRYVKIYSSKNKKHLIKSINAKTYTKIIRDSSLTPYFTWQAATDNLSGVNGYYIKFSDEDLKKSKVYKSKYYQTTKKLKTEIWAINKKHYLQVITQDNAGNISKFKTLLRYQVAI